jgi:hypothetical protein
VCLPRCSRITRSRSRSSTASRWVWTNLGVSYSGSTAKLAERGGFAHDDTNVVLLLSNPTFQPKTVHAPVGTVQVAPALVVFSGFHFVVTRLLPDADGSEIGRDVLVPISIRGASLSCLVPCKKC